MLHILGVQALNSAGLQLQLVLHVPVPEAGAGTGQLLTPEMINQVRYRGIYLPIM